MGNHLHQILGFFAAQVGSSHVQSAAKYCGLILSMQIATTEIDELLTINSDCSCQYRSGPPGFWKTVIFDNIFGSLLPLDCLINFIEKKIFNIMYNEIIMQRYQNIKFYRRKFSSSTSLFITLSFILLLFLIYKILLF
jgi:hypothetical protein